MSSGRLLRLLTRWYSIIVCSVCRGVSPLYLVRTPVFWCHILADVLVITNMLNLQEISSTRVRRAKLRHLLLHTRRSYVHTCPDWLGRTILRVTMITRGFRQNSKKNLMQRQNDATCHRPLTSDLQTSTAQNYSRGLEALYLFPSLVSIPVNSFVDMSYAETNCV